MWIRRRFDRVAAATVLAGVVAHGAIAHGQTAPSAPSATASSSASPASSSAPGAAPGADDPLGQYRERFKLGMDRYKEGALAEAVGYWEPIYRELGEQKGYRLAYNLGVAYAELGDVTRAADRLQSFLAEVDARRGNREALAPIVEKEETDARARIDALIASRGRLHVLPGSPARAAQVDASEPRMAGFVAWVTPGTHTVTFAPGTPDQETRSVDVRAGELLDVAPTPPPAPPASAPPSATTAPAASFGTPPVLRRETHHPFSPVLVAVSGGLGLAAGAAVIPLFNNASSLRDSVAREPYPRNPNDEASVYNARTWAYVTDGAAIGLAVVTAGLAAWYFLGSSTREVVVTPGGVAGRF